METEGSLPHSQVPPTCPHPETYRSNHALTSHFLKIHLNIILPSTRGSSKWSLSLRFLHQIRLYISTLPHTCCMPCPHHSSRFDHLHNIGCRVLDLWALYHVVFSIPCYFVSLRPQYSFQHRKNRLLPENLFIFKSPCCEKTETRSLSS
jgi:hypothetical protein